MSASVVYVPDEAARESMAFLLLELAGELHGTIDHKVYGFTGYQRVSAAELAKGGLRLVEDAYQLAAALRDNSAIAHRALVHGKNGDARREVRDLLNRGFIMGQILLAAIGREDNADA